MDYIIAVPRMPRVKGLCSLAEEFLATLQGQVTPQADTEKQYPLA
jgi:hypothetical protein